MGGEASSAVRAAGRQSSAAFLGARLSRSTALSKHRHQRCRPSKPRLAADRRRRRRPKRSVQHAALADPVGVETPSCGRPGVCRYRGDPGLCWRTPLASILRWRQFFSGHPWPRVSGDRGECIRKRSGHRLAHEEARSAIDSILRSAAEAKVLRSVGLTDEARITTMVARDEPVVQTQVSKSVHGRIDDRAMLSARQKFGASEFSSHSAKHSTSAADRCDRPPDHG